MKNVLPQREFYGQAPVSGVTAASVPRAEGTATPLVSFVIPVRDDAVRLRKCLESITGNNYPANSIELIVVDNGSKDDSPAVAAAAGARVLTLPGLRVGELRNRGAEVARGAVLAFVDADHVIDVNWIQSAVAALAVAKTGVVGALCHAPEDGTWVQRAYDRLRHRLAGRQRVEWLGSGNLAMSRELFRSLGGFDVDLETCEDVALCQRLRRAGYEVVSDANLRSTHYGDPRSLRALFLAERWRGRDNLRVSMSALTLRALPSVAAPVAGAGAAVLGLIGLAFAPAGLWVTAGAIATQLLITLMHTALITRRSSRLPPLPWLQLLVVTAVFDVARAVALLGRAPHRRQVSTS